jgi:hypothetical protein
MIQIFKVTLQEITRIGLDAAVKPLVKEKERGKGKARKTDPWLMGGRGETEDTFNTINAPNHLLISLNISDLKITLNNLKISCSLSQYVCRNLQVFADIFKYLQIYSIFEDHFE